MGYGKGGFGKERMCSYKLSHNSAVHTDTALTDTKRMMKSKAAEITYLLGIMAMTQELVKDGQEIRWLIKCLDCLRILLLLIIQF